MPRLAADGRKGEAMVGSNSSDELSDEPGRSLGSHVLRAGVFAVAAVAVGTVAVAVAAATAVARRVVVPARHADEDVKILSVDLASEPQTITLSLTPHSVLEGDPGLYSLWFADNAGHVVVGEILSRDDHSVTRAIVRRGFGDIELASRGHLNGWLWLSPADAGLESKPVAIRAANGLNPAWVIPGGPHSPTWVIHIHGHGSKRAENLRGAVSLAPWGFTQLIASYRNDGEGERSVDGRYALGATEWQDIDEAISYARENGATKVLLVGWSMGGAIALQTAERSAHRDIIVGLILDSPAVDWVDILQYQGDAGKIPGPVQQLTFGILGSRAGWAATGKREPVDFAQLRWPERAANLSVPVVLLHSDDDGFVPPGPSREFAAARTDLVTFVPFATAYHCRLWNYDRDKWESAVNTWLTSQGFARPEE